MKKSILQRYLFFLIALIVSGMIGILDPRLGSKSLNVTLFSLKEMLLILPPIFVLLGLLDVWVPRETMIRFMGEKSGMKGILLAIFLGSAAAGPLYGAFPVAAVFMKKGVKLTNVFIFLGAWSTTKIPMFLFEFSALGGKFAITRLLVDIPGIILIAILLAKSLKSQEIQELYSKMEALE